MSFGAGHAESAAESGWAPGRSRAGSHGELIPGHKGECSFLQGWWQKPISPQKGSPGTSQVTADGHMEVLK